MKIVEDISQKSSNSDREALEDLIIDFYLGHFTDIKRNWFPKSELDLIKFPVTSLEYFLAGGHKCLQQHVNKDHKILIRKGIEIIRVHCYEWYREYEQDPDFSEAVGKSYTWIRALKLRYVHPPKDAWSLKNAFWGAEAFLKLGDKKLL